MVRWLNTASVEVPHRPNRHADCLKYSDSPGQFVAVEVRQRPPARPIPASMSCDWPEIVAPNGWKLCHSGPSAVGSVSAWPSCPDDTKHCHSGIDFVIPQQAHNGQRQAIVEERRAKAFSQRAGVGRKTKRNPACKKPKTKEPRSASTP